MPHSPTRSKARARRGHRPWPRVDVDADGWRRAVERARRPARWTLLGLWGEHRRRPHGAARRAQQARSRSLTPRLPGRHVSLGRRACIRRPSGSSARSAISLGSTPVGAPDARPWLDLGCWGVAAAARRASAPPRRRGPPYRVPSGRRREPAPDSGRAGACRHHRARPFPLHRQRRDRGAARAAARLRPQGHRVADGGRRRSSRPRGLPARTSGDSTVAYALAFARAVEAALGIEAPPRARLSARADGRARAARQPSRRHRRDLQRRLVRAHACALRHPARAHAARGRRLLRPSADDGPRRAGRRRRRSRRRTARRSCATLLDEIAAAVSAAGRALRQHRLAAGPHRQHRHRLRTELARQFGAGGYVGRASGRAFDARKTLALSAL